jgi:hypothetical protein
MRVIKFLNKGLVKTVEDKPKKTVSKAKKAYIDQGE